MSTEKRNEMRRNYDMVRKNRFNEFMRGFSTITSKLKEMYQMITLGGDAELELVDSLDPFSEGINFRSVYIVICVTVPGIFLSLVPQLI
jgi:structural maintenance of chromosome 4